MLGLKISTNTVEFLVCVVPNSSVTLPKFYSSRSRGKAVILRSCFSDLLLRHSKMLEDKGFNLFDESATKWVHLSSLLPEGTVTCTYQEHRKFTEDANRNKWSGAIAKVRILVEIDTFKYLNIIIRNGKIVWKHRPYCWYFCLNLKYLEWPYRA